MEKIVRRLLCSTKLLMLHKSASAIEVWKNIVLFFWLITLIMTICKNPDHYWYHFFKGCKWIVHDVIIQEIILCTVHNCQTAMDHVLLASLLPFNIVFNCDIRKRILQHEMKFVKLIILFYTYVKIVISLGSQGWL